MNLIQILFFISTCFLYRLILNNKGLDWFVLIASITVIFWLQPFSTIRTLDYWIPAFSIALGFVSWMLVAKKESYNQENIFTGIIVLFFMLSIGFSRYIPILNIEKFISIPKNIKISIFIFIFGILLYLVKVTKKQTHVLWILISLIILLFILIKNDYLSYNTSLFLRKLNKQSTNLASSKEIVWMGYSYIAFRLIHSLIESKKSKGIDVSLKTYLSYLFYFPSFLAGPIDKLEDFRNKIAFQKTPRSDDFIDGGKRITIGLFQKFIIADTLAVFSINMNLAQEVSSGIWMWIMVLAYSFRIYFDFNGYTHLALGISRLLGIKLPENFNNPLQSPTITIFWNNWHITLTQWFRTYYFNPLTRFIKSKYKSINQQFLMGFMQVSTMILIGLWHGISYNFLAWGIWNGLGLFIQNRFSRFLLKTIGNGKPFWQISKLTKILSLTFTFIFVTMGWIWFALPDLNSSLRVFRVLIGR